MTWRLSSPPESAPEGPAFRWARRTLTEQDVAFALYPATGNVIALPLIALPLTKKEPALREQPGSVTEKEDFSMPQTVDDWLAEHDERKRIAAQLAEACDETIAHLDDAHDAVNRLADLAWSEYHKAAMGRVADEIGRARASTVVLRCTAGQEARS